MCARDVFDSAVLLRYGRDLMMRRSAGSRAIVVLAAGCFLAFALVAGGHVHQQASPDTVDGYCQLCALGQVRTESGVSLPALDGLVLLGWLAAESAVAAFSGCHASVAFPRAPPHR